MPLPAPTTISTFSGDASGSDYRQLTDQLLVADASTGTIAAVNPHTHVRTVLGTGFASLHEIVLSSDGLHAYVGETPGSVLRLALTNLNRSAATVVCSGLNGIQQIALDEVRGFAYVAEFTGGHIQKVNLSTGAKTVAITVATPEGVLITTDGRFLYVSSDDGTIRRFDLTTNTSIVVASGLGGPRHLTWADAGQSVILVPVFNPAGTVMKVDLSTTTATVSAITGTTPAAPYSVCVLSPTQLLITCASAIAEVDLTSSLINANGPILLAIGYVPADTVHLPGGFADTSMDPIYPYQFKDCPFGGSVPININWQAARAAGAAFYQVSIAGPSGPAVTVTQPFTDYLFSTTLNEYEAITTVPVNGFYPLRSAGQLWIDLWLGLFLDTTGQPNGLNKIVVTLYSAETVASQIGHGTDPGRSVTLMIDNTQPTALIETILQQPGNVPINTCSIVTGGAPTFTFQVTASAPLHLLAWSLIAGWGDNQSKTIASDTYANHVTPSRVWQGIANAVVPPPGPSPWNATVAGDPTSTHCAHSFQLAAWDRVINGMWYVHGPATYAKYITIML